MSALHIVGPQTGFVEALYPAGRGTESFGEGEAVFVPRSDGPHSGYAEASFGHVVDVQSYARPGSADYSRENSSTAFIKVLASENNRIPATYFIGDVTHAGIVPVRYAAEIVYNQAVRERWIDGAQWPETEDWGELCWTLARCYKKS